MDYLKICKLEEHQHYSNRDMVWFKWRIDCLQDFEFMALTPKQRWDFIGLICLACGCNNTIPYDTNYIERTINTNNIENSIEKLCASGMLAICYQNASPIRIDKIREEEKRKEVDLFDFASIWSKYPKRDGRKQAEVHFRASVKTEKDWQDINTALNNYLKSDTVVSGFIKNGSTWFNNWRDWIEQVKSGKEILLENMLKRQEELNAETKRVLDSRKPTSNI